MAQLRIDDVTESKSGKAWRVKSGNVWYSAFKDSGIEKHKGKTVDAEIETSEKYGPGIKKYKLIDLGSGSQTSQSGAPSTAWLPMASNTVAHAISAGLITEPGQIKLWTSAVKQALSELGDVPV